jgi:signal transduction histidine kinase
MRGADRRRTPEPEEHARTLKMQIDDRRFSRLTVLGVTAGVLLLLIAFAATIFSLALNQRSRDQVDHTYRVIDGVKQLELYIERAETGARGYLIVPAPARLRTYQLNSGRIAPELDNLASLVADNQAQRQNVERIRPIAAEELAVLEQTMKAAVSGDIFEAQRIFAVEVARERVARIRAIVNEMRERELRLLDERTSSERRTNLILTTVLGVTGLLMLLLGVTVIVVVRRYTESLQAARNRLDRLNTDLEGVVTERTADLQRANAEIQRFAYIVSHDLRSPLVNILGFTAELEETNKSLVSLIERAEKDAPQIITEDTKHAREDLPEAIGFIRASTQKMDRLINAILRLSREGRRTLTPESLDMSQVLGGIVASLEHRLHESGTSVTVEEPIPDIVSDRVAMEQIFSNLIENAVKYLQADRAGQVTVRGREDGDRVVYEVQDNGRGIDPRDHERIFDLFRRSGTQDEPGEGIGLAHVRALAYRLGGFIDVQSELGQGATFQVSLPVTYADQGAGN